MPSQGRTWPAGVQVRTEGGLVPACSCRGQNPSFAEGSPCPGAQGSVCGSGLPREEETLVAGEKATRILKEERKPEAETYLRGNTGFRDPNVRA